MDPTPHSDPEPELELELELCTECTGPIDDVDVFHDVDDQDRPYCAACCPTCIAELAEVGA